MVALVDIFIEGAPASTNNKATRDAWKASIRQQTSQLPAINSSCRLSATFHLAKEAYVTRPPFGPDLDNLAKPFLDALGETVLAPLGDECILELHLRKQPAASNQSAGVGLVIEGLETL